MICFQVIISVKMTNVTNVDKIVRDVISLKNVDYSFSSDTNNDANNAVAPPDFVTSISSSRASTDIVHPSNKTSNMDPSPSLVTKPVSIETSKGGKKETITFPQIRTNGKFHHHHHK